MNNHRGHRGHRGHRVMIMYSVTSVTSVANSLHTPAACLCDCTGGVTVRRHGTARTKALGLAEIDLRLTGFHSLEYCLPHKGLQDHRVGCDSGVDDQFYFPNPAVRRQRQLGRAVAADQIGYAEKSL